MPNYTPATGPFPNQLGSVAVTSTLVLSWNVPGVVTSTLALSWNVPGSVAGALELTYDVAQAGNVVTSRLRITWNVAVIRDICRAYRVVKGGDSFWKGFAQKSAVLSRGPLVNDRYNRYYLVRDGDAPRYTTYDTLELERRIRAEFRPENYYRLGVPQPSSAPSVEASGGDDELTVDRSYVYTWVSAFGEEGPPSDPTVVSGADDGDWLVSGFDTAVPFANERLVNTIRIYRTVSSSFGTVDYHFVGEISFNDGDFLDNIPTNIVGAQNTLESTNWFPPPADLKGLVEHPNGFFIGFSGRDIYMSEPYRPHAWPQDYVLSTLGDIVGFGIFGTSVVVCTESFPYVMNGINPNSMVLTQHDTAEPCLSRYGIVSMPNGVYYPGPNGLMLVSSRGFDTITEKLMTREEWQSRYTPARIDAARYQNSYVAFYSDEEGFLFTPTDPLYTFVELNTYWTNCGIQTDEYSGKVILCDGQSVYEWNPPTGRNVKYVWQSKEFDVPEPKNFGAFRIIFYGDPVPDDATIQKWRDYNALRITDPLGPLNHNALGAARDGYVDDLVNDTEEWRQPVGGPVLYPVPEPGQPWPTQDTLTAEFFANDQLVHTKQITTTDMLRLPSGFKATRWKIRLTGSYKIKSLKMAETGRELRSV